MDLRALMASRPRQVPMCSVLLAANVLVFVVMLKFGAGLWHTASGVQLMWGANFAPAIQDGQWWRLFSAMFIHFGVVHLVLNMWALWDVGRLMERLLGPLRLACVYLGAGAVGNVLSVVVQGSAAVSGGASGAVFGLYGALLVLLWRERAHVERTEFRWLFGGACGFTAVILGMGFVVPGIDNAAHGGGLVVGALLGFVLARPWVAGRVAHHSARWWVGAVLVVLVATLVARIPPPTYRFMEEMQARQAIAQFLEQDQRLGQRLSAIVSTGARVGLSFEALAGRIEDSVAQGYERSFEQLVQASPDTAVPSAQALQSMQGFASQRADNARELVQSLRARDPAQVRQALRQAQKPLGALKSAQDSEPPAAANPTSP
jgi:rhomboid protease GluP